MADKEVIIGGKKLMYGTSIKASPDGSNTTSTGTFDGAIVQGNKDIPYTIDLSKVRYDNATNHRELSELIDDMWENAQMVTIREIVRPNGEAPYVIVDNFFECLTDGNDYEIKTDDHTVENLKFKASRKERKYENL